MCYVSYELCKFIYNDKIYIVALSKIAYSLAYSFDMYVCLKFTIILVHSIQIRFKFGSMNSYLIELKE